MVLKVRKVLTMLSVVYFHSNAIRKAAHFEKSCSKISRFKPQKSEKSPGGTGY